MSAAFKSYNIVLFPSAMVKHQAIEWSRSVSRHFKTTYVLDVQTWHPHITLYQAHYPTINIEKIQACLAEITKETSASITASATFGHSASPDTVTY